MKNLSIIFAGHTVSFDVADKDIDILEAELKKAFDVVQNHKPHVMMLTTVDERVGQLLLTPLNFIGWLVTDRGLSSVERAHALHEREFLKRQEDKTVRRDSEAWRSSLSEED